MLTIIGIFVLAGIIKRRRQSGSDYSRPVHQSNHSDYQRGREDERRREEEYEHGRGDERERIRQEKDDGRKERKFYRECAT